MRESLSGQSRPGVDFRSAGCIPRYIAHWGLMYF